MVEEQTPDEVDPAADAGNADAEDESEDVVKVRLLDKRTDTDDDLDYPVDARD